MMPRRFSRLLLAALVFVCAAPMAQAFASNKDDHFQGKQGAGSRKVTNPYDRDLKFKSHPGYPPAKDRPSTDIEGRLPEWLRSVEAGDRVLPRVVYASLLADSSDPELSVLLRLEIPQTLQTCMEFGPLEYSREISNEIFLDIAIHGMEVLAVDPVSPGCVHQVKPSVDIQLRRDELAGVRKVRFFTAEEIDYYDVVLTENHVALRESAPEIRAVRPLEDARLDDPLGAYFYPQGTVVLFVPRDVGGTDVGPQVERFAASRGLTPVGNVIPGFRSGMREDRTWYFVDRSGGLAPTLEGGPDGHWQQIGYVSSWKTVRDVSGERRLPVNIEVYARRPVGYE
ncbi:MAG: hypothetical protein EOM26_10045 [Alphaproteobacteria bacterium]|nr:hypothetical protein [Alphaproteobacteria bacterium]